MNETNEEMKKKSFSLFFQSNGNQNCFKNTRMKFFPIEFTFSKKMQLIEKMKTFLFSSKMHKMIYFIVFYFEIK